MRPGELSFSRTTPRRLARVAVLAALCAALVAGVAATRDARAFATAYRTINFDRLATGSVVTEQYPGAQFSAEGRSLKVVNLEQEGLLVPGHSSPNMLCPDFGGGGGEVMRIDFTTPVDYLTFVIATKSERTRPRGSVVGSVTVVHAGSRSKAPVVIDGNLGVDLVDLSPFRQISGIVIHDLSDDGLLLDDFEFSQIRPFSDPVDAGDRLGQ